MLFEPAELERRFRVVQKGMKEEFWKVVTESLQARNLEDMQQVIRFHAKGMKSEAERLSLIVQARQDVINEPFYIAETNKSIFDRYILEPCKVCGNILKKIKERVNATSN